MTLWYTPGQGSLPRVFGPHKTGPDREGGENSMDGQEGEGATRGLGVY